MSVLTQSDIEAIAREVARFLVPEALMTVEDICALVQYEPRYVSEKLLKQPGAPRPARLGGPQSQPRYRRADIIEWIDSSVAGKGRRGRPREN